MLREFVFISELVFIFWLTGRVHVTFRLAEFHLFDSVSSLQLPGGACWLCGSSKFELQLRAWQVSVRNEISFAR